MRHGSQYRYRYRYRYRYKYRYGYRYGYRYSGERVVSEHCSCCDWRYGCPL